VADETRAVCIDEVRLALDSAFLNGDLEILDTPGLGSVHARHTRRAKEITKAADLVAYVFPDRGPADGDLQFLAWMHEVNKVLDTSKVFWIVNMIDKCIDEEAREDPDPASVERCIRVHQERIASDLLTRGFASARVFPVSAECARRATVALAEPGSAKARRRLSQIALWFGDESEPDPQTNLRLSGLPALTSELRRYLADHGLRLRRDAARQRCIAWSQAVAQDGEQRSALAKLNLDQLVQLHEQVRGLRARVESGSSSERARTERSLRQLIKEFGRDPLAAELEQVINETAEHVAANWKLSFLSLKTNWRAAGHWLKKTLGEGESKLEQDIASRVRAGLKYALDDLNTRERFAEIHVEMRAEIRAEVNESLKRIRKDIADLEVKDKEGRSFFVFLTASALTLDQHLVDATLNDVVERLTTALGLGGMGAVGVLVDVLLFGGLITIMTAISFAYAKLKKWTSGMHIEPPQTVQQQLQDKISKAVRDATPEAIKRAIEEPLDDFTWSLLEQYRGRVEKILNDVEERVQAAKQTVDKQASDSEALERELNQAARQLLAFEHRCAALMPASVP
jgi:hypothetical protein